MKILSSQIAANNQYQSQFVSKRQVTTVKTAASDVDISGLKPKPPVNNSSNGPASTSGPEGQKALSENAYYDKSIFIMKLLLEKMTGKAFELFNPNEFMNQANEISNRANELQNGAGSQPPQNPEDLIMVEQYRFESESNQLSFSGSITLEDGSETHFNYAVGFSQKHESLSVEVMQRQELKDPLVISFTSKPIELSNKRFEFDIDDDHKKDSIPLLEAGYGFLALDKNQDGTINSGSELFGALSGNGFADLANYDDDGNGFIDENDKVFSQLSVWIKNEGDDKLVSLKEANIGAIGLQNAETPFTVRSNASDDDEKLAIIRKSGFYLSENGKPGLIQQLDFIV